jgi:enterochelin esterase-like enzyme
MSKAVLDKQPIHHARNMTPVDPRLEPSYTTANRRPRRSAARQQADGVFFWVLCLASALTLLALAITVGPASADSRSGPASERPSHGFPDLSDQAGQGDSCSSTHGRIERDEITVEGQPRPLPFRVYLPPCYDSSTGQRYPVLYLLHGLLGTDAQWDEYGADEAADDLIASGAIPPFIIVMPWERTGLQIETALVDGLIDHIDRTYRTQAQARWRAIGGLSRGGGQALEIGLRHPLIFGQISMHSPAVLHGDVLLVRWLDAIPAGKLPALWVDIGLQDSLLPSTEHLVEFLFQQDIAPTLQFNSGDHLPEYWKANLPNYLRWHGGLWRAQQMRENMRSSAAEAEPTHNSRS